jgi:hypothetical protein
MQPYFLTDRDEISNFYRGPSIDAFYQVSAQLAKQFQGRRFFRNRPVAAMFANESGRNEQSL